MTQIDNRFSFAKTKTFIIYWLDFFYFPDIFNKTIPVIYINIEHSLGTKYYPPGGGSTKVENHRLRNILNTKLQTF